MKPWDIIGWAIIAFVSLLVSVPLLRWLLAWLMSRLLHYTTRNTQPAVGQVWMAGGTRLYITEMYDNGEFVVSTAAREFHFMSSHSSWREKPAEWRQRVRDRKLWLVHTETYKS